MELRHLPRYTHEERYIVQTSISDEAGIMMLVFDTATGELDMRFGLTPEEMFEWMSEKIKKPLTKGST